VAFKRAALLDVPSLNRENEHLAGDFENLRVETRSGPEGDDRGDGDSGGEVGGELVVAGRDASEVLEAAEGGLDAPTILVAGFVVADRALAVASPRDDRGRPARLEGAPERVGVVSAVGDRGA
jgi:hypothetical protein